MPPGVEQLWSLRDVTLRGRYRPRLEAVSLDIPRGKIAVMGSSGSGKTSLLNLLVGFDTPSTGKIVRCFAADPHRLPLYWSPSDMGLWPQQTVAQHIEAVIPAKAIRTEVMFDWLKRFDLEPQAQHYPHQLSQGEQSRLAVARALASQARVLVLDEPLAHVSPAKILDYWRIVEGTCESLGIDLIFATHSLDLARKTATHVLVLEDGQVVYQGDTRTLETQPPNLAAAQGWGPCYWLQGSPCQNWFRESSGHNVARPEWLELNPADDGPLEWLESRSLGTLQQSRVREWESQREHHLLHRPHTLLPQSGQRVWLRMLLCLALMLGLIGCKGAWANGDQPVPKTQATILSPVGAKIPAPRAVHATRDRLYVLDNAGRVLSLDHFGTTLDTWWMPAFSVGKPEKICLLRDGRLAVADTHYHRVVYFHPDGKVAGMQGKLGREPGEFIYPVAIAEDPAGNLYVCEYGGNDRIQKFSPEGRFIKSFGKPGTGPGEFQRPSGIVYRDKVLYVVDAFNNRIQRFSDEGEYLGFFGDTQALNLEYPYDIASSPNGDFYVVEYTGGRVSRLTREGQLVRRYGRTGANEGELQTPWGVSVSPQGTVWVADTGNRRLMGWKP